MVRGHNEKKGVESQRRSPSLLSHFLFLAQSFTFSVITKVFTVCEDVACFTYVVLIVIVQFFNIV